MICLAICGKGLLHHQKERKKKKKNSGKRVQFQPEPDPIPIPFPFVDHFAAAAAATGDDDAADGSDLAENGLAGVGEEPQAVSGDQGGVEAGVVIVVNEEQKHKRWSRKKLAEKVLFFEGKAKSKPPKQ